MSAKFCRSRGSRVSCGTRIGWFSVKRMKSVSRQSNPRQLLLIYCRCCWSLARSLGGTESKSCWRLALKNSRYSRMTRKSGSNNICSESVVWKNLKTSFGAWWRPNLVAFQVCPWKNRAQWSKKGQNETVKNGDFWSKNGQNDLFLVGFCVFDPQDPRGKIKNR